jgi:hypothetical protein
MSYIQPAYQRFQALMRKIKYLGLELEARQYLNNYYKSQAIRRSAESDWGILACFARERGVK